MSHKNAGFKFTIVAASGLLAACANNASAQWGTNAPPCPSHCCPSPWWGYVQTRWNRWPGAMYPDMVKPSATGTTDEIPAPGIELPTPKKETDLRSTTP